MSGVRVRTITLVCSQVPLYAEGSAEWSMWRTRTCDVLVLLAEVCIADEQCERALDELATAEAKQRQFMPADDRRLAETFVVRAHVAHMCVRAGTFKWVARLRSSSSLTWPPMCTRSRWL